MKPRELSHLKSQSKLDLESGLEPGCKGETVTHTPSGISESIFCGLGREGLFENARLMTSLERRSLFFNCQAGLLLGRTIVLDRDEVLMAVLMGRG